MGVDTDDAARVADMRIEIVKRELNQGALAGSGCAVTDYAARLVIAALDSFDEATRQQAYDQGYQDGFESGHRNGVLHAKRGRAAGGIHA
jgi:hypothetical protein